MASGKSDYLINKILNYVLGLVTYTPPATVYVELYTAAPTSAGGGTPASTGAWTNYARVAVTNNTTNWPTVSNKTKINGTAVDFGTAVVPGANVTVVAFAIFDASTSGNMLHWADLAASKIIQNGSPTSFAAGALTWTEA